jgi:hypothetical protein
VTFTRAIRAVLVQSRIRRRLDDGGKAHNPDTIRIQIKFPGCVREHSRGESNRQNVKLTGKISHFFGQIFPSARACRYKIFSYDFLNLLKTINYNLTFRLKFKLARGLRIPFARKLELNFPPVRTVMVFFVFASVNTRIVR